MQYTHFTDTSTAGRPYTAPHTLANLWQSWICTCACRLFNHLQIDRLQILSKLICSKLAGPSRYGDIFTGSQGKSCWWEGDSCHSTCSVGQFDDGDVVFAGRSIVIWMNDHTLNLTQRATGCMIHRIETNLDLSGIRTGLGNARCRGQHGVSSDKDAVASEFPRLTVQNSHVERVSTHGHIPTASYSLM